MADLDLLTFLSDNAMDKSVFPILVSDINTITIVNDGNTAPLLGANTAKIVESIIPNPYNRPCLVRARWSIDGGLTWQTLDSRILYGFTYIVTGIGNFPNGGLDSSISIGVNDSQIIFRTANGKHGDVTQTGGVDSYTPVSRSFLIEYWLYERE